MSGGNCSDSLVKHGRLSGGNSFVSVIVRLEEGKLRALVVWGFQVQH